ncbi:hypothetical protein PPYR_06931 [Photinus pyralis]|uniref:Ras-associating domain-containing protein n=2 Tax=Photinus pyralis TaxID=7054 RepID=A0A1Y1KC28_PHOPY|nr:ras association domain-containing protein 8 [Photinus pyralis]KAB0799051.1 hypothetical protein PPYR_06931 [Photinus pyralis]
MELKVWVEGIQRIVCGVSENTTCQDVVYALAHATGKSGRFTLIERWRNNERQLAPNENPLKILLKWGEYSNDVQFILQRSDINKNTGKGASSTTSPSPSTPSRSVEILDKGKCSPEKSKDVDRNREVQKSLTFSGSTYNTTFDNVGVVKGVPQVKNVSVEVCDNQTSPKKCSQIVDTDSPSHRVVIHPLAPPPYRDPPPPSASVNYDKFKKNEPQKNFHLKSDSKLDETVINTQYRELISLVNCQREKLSTQQVDLSKFDAEIIYWEGKEREKQFQYDFIAQEIISVGNTSKLNNEQIQALGYVEEESEIVKQQEKTLKSEITLLRSKLANCETELLQCKNKMRLVMEELQLEQRVQSRRNDSRKQLEKSFLMEVERLQKDIEAAKQSTELHHLTADTLIKEVAALEVAIIEKKKQLEHLVHEMKEANLQSLSIAPPDELRHIFEGPNRAGSTRKMIGSPRQLENAVPTNKNPHGVWV